MRIYEQRILEKLKRKNRGNKKLQTAINDLIKTIEKESQETQIELAKSRPDVDCVRA